MSDKLKVLEYEMQKKEFEEEYCSEIIYNNKETEEYYESQYELKL